MVSFRDGEIGKELDFEIFFGMKTWKIKVKMNQQLVTNSVILNQNLFGVLQEQLFNLIIVFTILIIFAPYK